MIYDYNNARLNLEYASVCESSKTTRFCISDKLGKEKYHLQHEVKANGSFDSE